MVYALSTKDKKKGKILEKRGKGEGWEEAGREKNPLINEQQKMAYMVKNDGGGGWEERS